MKRIEPDIREGRVERIGHDGNRGDGSYDTDFEHIEPKRRWSPRLVILAAVGAIAIGLIYWVTFHNVRISYDPERAERDTWVKDCVEMYDMGQKDILPKFQEHCTKEGYVKYPVRHVE